MRWEIGGYKEIKKWLTGDRIECLSEVKENTADRQRDNLRKDRVEE